MFFSFSRPSIQVISIFAIIASLDLFPFIISRFLELPSAYAKSDASLSLILFSFLMVLAALALVTLILLLMKKYIRIRVNVPIKSVLIVGIFATLYTSYMLNGLIPTLGGARYQSGGFTPITLVFYALNNSIFIFVIFWLAKYQYKSRSLLWIAYIYFFLQLLLVDGAGPLITLMCGIIIINAKVVNNTNFLRTLVLLTFVVVGGALLKFYQTDAGQLDRSAEDILSWVIGRYGLKYETFLMWLNGESVISGPIAYYDLLFKSLGYRSSFISGEAITDFPKTLAEAIYFDLYGLADGGSSPGLIYGLWLSGFGGIILPLVIVSCMKQYFSDLDTELTFLQLLAFSWIFSTVFANLFEIQILLSPSFALASSFFFAALFYSRAVYD